MHKLASNVPVLEHEVSELRLILERHAGVLLEATNECLAERIAERVEALHLNSASELIGRLQTSGAECEELLELLLDGETGFFRCPAALDALTRVALPEIESRKSRQNPRSLRIWSAGCSTGEEAYSIAMAVCEAINGGKGGWNIQIVGSDIRREALQVAERGLYPQESLQAVPRPLLQEYFSRVGQHSLVKPRLRNLVTFTAMNLAHPVYIGRFDCIFCMGVLPRFSMAQRIALVQRLHLYLEPGGYLFVGQGEKVPTIGVGFQRQLHTGYALNRKPLAASAASGRF